MRCGRSPFGRAPIRIVAAAVALAAAAALHPGAGRAADSDVVGELAVVSGTHLRTGQAPSARLPAPVARSGWIAPSAVRWVRAGRLLFSAHAAAAGRPGEAGRINIEVADLYLGPPGAPERITSGTARSVSPDVDADGRRIAFTSDLHDAGAPRLHTQEIYLLTLPGREVRRLTRSRGHKYAPAWSPDGRSIAFGWQAGGTGIHALDRFGTSLHLLDVASGAVRKIADDANQPTWSPDGRRLAFLRRGSLYAMPSAGGPAALLLASTSRRRISSPRWTRHGVVYTWRDPFGGAQGVALLRDDETTVELWSGRPGEMLGAADLL